MTELFSQTLSLSSGYTVSVQPLPPYYVDFIEDELPYFDYPKRKLQLAAGDVVGIEYTPPEASPNVDNVEEFELYARWQSAKQANIKIDKLRERVRRDFLLSTCVMIIDGPLDVNSDVWVLQVEASFKDYKVPVHFGKRILAFLKSQVIRSDKDYKDIINSAMFPEVSMQGVEDSLRGFQNALGRSEFSRGNQI